MKRSILPEWLATEENKEEFIQRNCVYQRGKSSHAGYAVDEKLIGQYVFDLFLPYLAEHGYILKKVRIKEENKRGYLQEGRYLPEFLQDFHDQKNFFKILSNQPEAMEELPWIKAHIFVVDFFLWNAMREYGYTLQKSTRKDLGTKCAWSTLANYENEQRTEKAKFLWEIIAQSRKDKEQDGK